MAQLYAADIEISIDIRHSSLISKSMEQWELISSIPDTVDKQNKNEVEKKQVDGNGFRRGIRRTSKAKKLKLLIYHDLFISKSSYLRSPKASTSFQMFSYRQLVQAQWRLPSLASQTHQTLAHGHTVHQCQQSSESI